MLFKQIRHLRGFTLQKELLFSHKSHVFLIVIKTKLGYIYHQGLTFGKKPSFLVVCFWYILNVLLSLFVYAIISLKTKKLKHLCTGLSLSYIPTGSLISSLLLLLWLYSYIWCFFSKYLQTNNTILDYELSHLLISICVLGGGCSCFRHLIAQRNECIPCINWELTVMLNNSNRCSNHKKTNICV